MTNKILLLLIISVVFSTSGIAQKRKGKEKIKAYKIAFLTEKLNLSSSEATKFWPIYNAYDKKMQELHYKKRVEIRKKIKQIGDINALNEKDARNLVEKIHFLEEERLKIKKRFFNEIKSILSYKRLLQLEIAEHDFNRKLMRRLRKKMQQ